MANVRLQGLRGLLAGQGADALLVASPANCFYLSGFTGEDSYLLVTASQAYLFTDRRFLEQAAAEAPGFELIDRGASLMAKLGEALAAAGVKTLVVEEDHTSLRFFRELTRASAEPEAGWPAGLALKPLSRLAESPREVKDESEIELIRQAVRLADAAFAHILAYLKTGVAEVEVAAEIEYFLRRHGAAGVSFPTIVASGSRASLPHGRASAKKLAQGDLVVMDFGVILAGYCSDLTRTVAIGPATAEQESAHRVVRQAQERACAGLQAGVRTGAAYQIARDYIDATEFAGCFTHSLGHGVGIEVHEGPALSPMRDQELKAGMVVTVEPGVYVPGWGGVRIEDMVVIRAGGCENLTSAAKDFIVL